MSDQFLAEIRIFPFNFAPTGWAFCDGQILPLSQNTALFSLLGTTYGGDGKSTFALPDIQGNSVMQPGQGPGLSLRDLGEIGGEETVTLLISEIPVHTHNIMASAQPSSTGQPGPAGTMCLARGFGGSPYKATPFSNGVNMAPQTLAPAGGNLPHQNMMPYITLNY